MEAAQWLLSIGANFFEAIHLSSELSQLQKSVLSARLLIDHAEWGSFKNKDLAEQLSQLKDTTYDAEDLLREFDDQAQRQKLEEADQNMAGQFLSSSLDLVKSWITGSKTRVKEAQSNLDKALSAIYVSVNLMGLKVEPVQQLMPETSSVIGVPQVFGRDDERDEVIKILGVTTGRDNDRDQVIKRLGVPLNRGGRSAGATRKRSGSPSTSKAKRSKGKTTAVAPETNCTGDVCVLPIVGIGGVGKTTLAQFIYNDARVKAHFNVRIWVCVSDLFDKRRITNEIIESIPWEEEYNPSGSLDALQVELMKRLMGNKFLLVLDDVWSNANDEWEAFYAPLRHGLAGSMVLVTTRCRDVADRVKTVEPVQLEGLPNDIFWEFFKKCAFGKERPESYPQLLEIGQNIARRLCGSPLAAKTLGRLLNMDLNVQHWTTIQDSELWELQNKDNEILPALRLSYLYLPSYLKRCFAVCSMFPKDYSFERDEIVEFWVAQGLVTVPGGNMRPEYIGSSYLDDLRSRSLFQADPKVRVQSRYVMHDLIHDMAQSVSVDECFLMKGLSNQRTMPHTVRHMSIEVDSEALSRMTCINHLNKLHSLRFGTRFKVEISWFNQLSNILFLSLKGCKLEKLPEGICVLNHLRYLDISYSSIKELPEKFWCLYSLQVIDACPSSLKKIDEGVTKLVNLRRLALPTIASLELSRIHRLGNLSSLRNLSYFSVGKVNGRRISELKGMNQLSGTLHIKSLVNVQSREEGTEARLVDKQYLKDLVLQWRMCRDESSHLRRQENEVLEALRPPSSIESLEVKNFAGDISPSWLKPENLPTLRILELHGCNKLKQLALQGVGNKAEVPTTFLDGTPNGSTGDDRTQHASISSDNGNACLPFTGLTTLRLASCRELTNLDQFLSPNYLPSIKTIQLYRLLSLESLPVHNFGGFVCLQELSICNCRALVCTREMVLPPSLRLLSFSWIGQLDKSFRPGCLENLASLTLLSLEACQNMESILLNSINTNNLKYLVLRNCSELSSIGGLHAFSSIQHVIISDCPKLTEVEQPFKKKELPPEEEKELLKFIERW